MKKINILKKNTDFDRIIKSHSSYKYKDYIVYIEKNTDGVYHFGLSVGKKIGNAVLRNRVKRQLKEIISKNSYQNNFNCIIIVRRGVLNKSFEQMSNDLWDLFKRLDILKEKTDEEN